MSLRFLIWVSSSPIWFSSDWLRFCRFAHLSACTVCFFKSERYLLLYRMHIAHWFGRIGSTLSSERGLHPKTQSSPMRTKCASRRCQSHVLFWHVPWNGHDISTFVIRFFTSVATQSSRSQVVCVLNTTLPFRKWPHRLMWMSEESGSFRKGRVVFKTHTTCDRLTQSWMLSKPAVYH